jgi:hypothetical protein
MADQIWQVGVALEQADRTGADAELEPGRRFGGFGEAKHAQQDPDAPVIGQVARPR